MKVVLTTLLSVSLLFGFVACTSKDDAAFQSIQSTYHNFSLDKISEIKVINGNNGERFSIIDENKIREIFDLFSKLLINDTEQPKEESTGYGYEIRFYNDSEKALSVIYGDITDTLLINQHLYIVEDINVIQSAIDYFDENTK